MLNKQRHFKFANSIVGIQSLTSLSETAFCYVSAESILHLLRLSTVTPHVGISAGGSGETQPEGTHDRRKNSQSIRMFIGLPWWRSG